MKSKLKVFLFIDLAILLIFISYKIYLFAFEKDYQSVNISSIKEIENHVGNHNDMSFAVLGNIENSIDIFDKKMVRTINQDKDIDFVISTGNAVLDGSEDKYRIFNKSLNKLNAPVISVIGDHEIADGGAFRYYKHFGPFYYSFSAGNSYFIVLDTTGKTSEKWQKEWLKTELDHGSDYKHTFVFMNRSPYEIHNKSLIEEPKYIKSKTYRDFLTNLFSNYHVDAVFSSGASLFDSREIKDVNYYNSGGGGGALLLNSTNSFFHYIKVNVNGDHVAYQIKRVNHPSNFTIRKLFENIWIYIHSIFYINFVNFFLILSLLIILAIFSYVKITKEVDYYRDFSHLQRKYPEKEKLTIAMFTNNYLPFIGGVPISIYRLAKGLRKEGHTVYIFAPKYPGIKKDSDPCIIRCNLMTYYKTKKFDYPIVNIFSPRIEKEFAARHFDVIHVHHPFWMGWKGLKLAQKYKVPVVFTYHTRLDSYYHYIPFMKIIFKNILSHKMIKQFAQKCHAVIAPTVTAKEYLSNIGVSRSTTVLPTGIDFDVYHNLSDEKIKTIRDLYVKPQELLLCSVSRLSKEKNIYFLIESIRHIKKTSMVPFTCIIIGDGPEKDNLIRIIEEYQLQETIKLVGAVSPEDVSAYYLASDLFLFSSKSETQGMVLLEAMAGRCPVVAVTSSGIDDVIKNDYNGYKTLEKTEEWTDKVVDLLSNQEKLKAMSENAYHFAKGHSIDAMARRSLKIYRKVIRETASKYSKKSLLKGETDKQ